VKKEMSTYKRKCEADVIVFTCILKAYGSILARNTYLPFYLQTGFVVFLKPAGHIRVIPEIMLCHFLHICSGSFQFEARRGGRLFVVFPSPSSPDKCRSGTSAYERFIPDPFLFISHQLSYIFLLDRLVG
jgi:hypothetical protein